MPPLCADFNDEPWKRPPFVRVLHGYEVSSLGLDFPLELLKVRGFALIGVCRVCSEKEHESTAEQVVRCVHVSVLVLCRLRYLTTVDTTVPPSCGESIPEYMRDSLRIQHVEYCRCCSD